MARVVKSELPTVSLKSEVLAIPTDQERKIELVANLTAIGCEGLLVQPWNLKNEDMAREFLKERSNKWEGTIRWNLEWWTADR